MKFADFNRNYLNLMTRKLVCKYGLGIILILLMILSTVMTGLCISDLKEKHKAKLQDIQRQSPEHPITIIMSNEYCDHVEIPIEYIDIFNEMGGKYHVDPSLLAAIAKQESQFKIDAISPKGAMGLMGLMPITIKHLKEKHGLDVDPWNPRSAIEGAAAYLQELQTRFNEVNALAAYNMGPTRLRRLRGDFSSIQETSTYVSTVQKIQAEYETRKHFTIHR